MTEIEFRSFDPQLEVRSGGDGRTVTGRAVPYEVAQQINPRLIERFRRGAFARQLGAASRVRFAREHMKLGGALIGKVTELRDASDALMFEARVSNTPLGNETLELLRDGALDQMSIGFQARQNGNLPGGIVERVTAHLSEIAVVLEGAYGELAVATGVRSAHEYTCSKCGEKERMEEAKRILNGLPKLLPL